MYEGTFTYPMERDDWLKTVLIGGVLTFFGFLLIPLFVVYGYVVETIRTSIDGERAPPAFEDWGSLLVDGLKAWVIGLVYLLVPAVVAWVTVGGAFVAMATGGRAGAAAGVAGLVGGLVLSGVLALLFGYVGVAGLVNFAHERRFGAAFDIGAIRDVVLSVDYAVAWLISVALFVVGGIVASIPLVGFVLGPFVWFYVAVVAGRLWAGAYVDALEMAEGEDPVEDRQAAA